VASPDLLDGVRDRADDPGVEAALVRYVSRMASRPTRFGRFAACGIGTISDHTTIELPPARQWRRHTRLDGDYLDRVVRARAKVLRDRLTFRPNDSLYATGARWRYVQSRHDGLERTHHLAEINDSEPLARTLAAAADGATIAQLAAAVAEGGVDDDRAAQYVDQLIGAQVLVPTIAVTLTGPLPLDALIADLTAVRDHETVTILDAVRRELAALDTAGAITAPARNEHIADLLRELAVPA
jgi:hypothetical protein